MIRNVGENITSGIILSGTYLDKLTPCAKIAFCTRHVMFHPEKSVVLFLCIVSIFFTVAVIIIMHIRVVFLYCDSLL